VYTNRFIEQNEALAQAVADDYYQELEANWEFGPDL
jgi:hypothetical protein